MKTVLIMIVGLTTNFALGAVAESLKFIPNSKSEVQFEAKGKPSLLKIKGHGAQVSGWLKIENQQATGEFEIKLSELDTGIALRNEHMKDNYLKVKEFPKATLKIEPIALPAAWKPGDSVSNKFKGQLSLKGKSKAVQGEFKVSGKSLESEANFTIQLSDFDLGVPKYMGITVADTVNIQVKVPSFERKD